MRRTKQHPQQPSAPREYTATITYRPGDEPARDVASCPQVFNGGFATEDAREQYIAKTCHDLTHQPTPPQYEIVSVERGDRCGKCSGVGTIKVRPKGWRSATAPPWYMLREKPCPACNDDGTTTNVTTDDTLFRLR